MRRDATRNRHLVSTVIPTSVRISLLAHLTPLSRSGQKAMSASPEDEEFDSDPESEIFVVNGKRVKFYLWGTQEEKERSWELSEGQREALRDKILVRFIFAFRVVAHD